MISVVFLGFGNVNFHLAKAFNASEKISIKAIYNRSLTEVPKQLSTITFTQKFSAIPEADVYIIGIVDNAIASFSANLPFANKLVVHTSGSMTIDVIDSKNKAGVFYPLQSFSKNRPLSLKKVPICIEASNTEDEKLLMQLASHISESVYRISSEERGRLHLAAVFVNNFTNHLFTIASEITKQSQLDFKILQPLIEETVQKLYELTPQQSQTGPALRNDTKTIKKHLDLLVNSPYRKLYNDLTKSIQITYGKKL